MQHKRLDGSLPSLSDLTVSLTALILFHFLRHLGEYDRSTESLTKALSKKNHLEELEVADILKELSATVSSYGEYTQSRLIRIAPSFR